MGSRAYGLDLAGPLAFDGVRLGAGLGDQARSRAGHRFCARRSAGRRRRAGRHSGPDAAELEPQHHREDGAGHRPRPDRARQPAAVFRALAAVRGAVAVRPVESDRGRARHVAQLSANGAHGHVVQVVDPAEETFPYLRPRRIPRAGGLGSVTAGRAESLARRLSEALAAHRAAMRAETDQLGWSFIIHRTDRPADRTAARAACAHGCRAPTRRHAPRRRSCERGGRAHDRRHCRSLSHSRWCCSALLSLPVLWWLLRLVPPRPRRDRISAGRGCCSISLPKEETPARTPWWLTLLRLSLAALLIFAAAGPMWNPAVATSQADRRRSRC